MRRSPLALAVAALVTTALAVPAGGTSTAADAAAPRPTSAAAADRGAPGTWTKVSTGTGSTLFEAGLYRTPDRVLHVLYPRDTGDNTRQLGHTAVSAAGTTVSQSTVLGSPWVGIDSTPALVGTPDGGLRAIFGGQQTTTPGFYSDGRMYTATAPAAGTSWTLPGEAVGISTSAVASYGTAATTLADGTPVAAFPLNSTITWHVGTGDGPDQSFDIGGCCAYDMAMVRSGDEVWIGWYANGGSSSTNGTFVRRILPTLGPIMKAPLSSTGTDSTATGRVALAARTGGGVYAAYCSGSGCGAIRLWKVGASSAATAAKGNRYARIALAPAPGGRLWLAWSDDSPRVRALRTSTTATRFGAVRDLRVPAGTRTIHSLAVEGSTGRGDVVVNTGTAFWHTQALAGLSLSASPTTWKHGTKRAVRFTVSDAGSRVAGARVAVGARRCTTGSTGQCSITFPATVKAGRLTATATKTSYGAGTARLRVT